MQPVGTVHHVQSCTCCSSFVGLFQQIVAQLKLRKPLIDNSPSSPYDRHRMLHGTPIFFDHKAVCTDTSPFSGWKRVRTTTPFLCHYLM
ncbi:hypothetical protein AAZX31_15G154800 [Glycine max]